MTQNDEFLYQLRIANPIDSVVGAYVNLIKRGHNYVCSCPFHSEKTPSCTVYNDSQSFYCFGCGAGGDVITFIMKIENLDFREAINFLAARAGLTVPEDRKNSEYAQRKTRIYEINRLAANFFYKNLLKGTDIEDCNILHSVSFLLRQLKNLVWDLLLTHIILFITI